jgi:hypothetical protein
MKVVGAIVGSIVLLTAAPATSADILVSPQQPAPASAQPVPPLPPLSPYYFGAAFNWAHHTGYVPYLPWNVNQYTPGGKAFVGYRFTDPVRFELAYHYLGRATFDEGSPVLSSEQSHAVSGSVVLMSPALSQIGPTMWHFFVRLGLAYKHITHERVTGTVTEGILSGVIGAGPEVRLTERLFARLEYEFISTAIGGPRQRVPALHGIFNPAFGGTRRTINVMHTPLALTLGYNF